MVSLEEKGLLNSLLDEGLCIIESSVKIGSGSIEKYQITANSLGKIFFEIFENHNSNLFRFLENKKSYQELLKFYDEAPPLPLVGEFLGDIGRYISRKVESNSNCEVLKMTKVTSIQLRKDGLYEVNYAPVFYPKESQKIIAEKVLYNVGGMQPQVSSMLDDIDDRKIVYSEDFIQGIFDRKLEGLLSSNSEGINISIIGNSHSAFSTLYRLKNQFGLLNNKKVKINMLYRSPLRLFYNSVQEAIADGYSFSDEDICPSSNRVNRYSGLRYDSFKLVKEILNGTFNNFFFRKANSVSKEELSNSDLIIVCTGYRSHKINLLDDDNSPLEFLYEHDFIKMNESCNPLLSDGRELKNFYQYGLGAGLNTGGKNFGETSYKGKIDGVWVYQHLIPERIFGKEFLESNIVKSGETV
ncbi:hypothetical protein [Bacillus wiedmannii]|uniref:Uncharacterized protein n=1 Tax=Bacillus wiedmannii TaxID=1890302 RepID=A0A2B6UFG3_9BACI|nr:hypothetical protein [Bacillus wiedmannii]PGD64011.1 hypothetical protein COM41_12150 [Bacillus wiedmannii]PHG57227.1 hypothetical protein COI65_23340 [Bacillus wiedmannii]